MQGEKGISRPHEHTFRFLLSASGGSSSSAGTLSISSAKSSSDSSASCQVREAEKKHERKRQRHLLNTLLGRSLLLCDLLFDLFSSGCFFGWCGLLLWLFFFFICAIYLFAFIFSFLGTLVSALLDAESNIGMVALERGFDWGAFLGFSFSSPSSAASPSSSDFC